MPTVTTTESRPEPIYRVLASTLTALRNCERIGSDGKPRNPEWATRHAALIDRIMRDTAPSGGGIDNGTSFDFGRSGSDKLVFITSFHHMNADGYYDGWTEHTVTVRPSFNGIDITIAGRDRNEIKDYLAEVFGCWLQDQITHDADGRVRVLPRTA